MRALFVRQLRDRRSAALGWFLGWSVLVAMYVATWPTVRAHAEQYDEILAGLPKAMRSAIGAEGEGTFSTPGGYLTAELLGVTGPVVAVTMGVLLGISCLVRDEEDGTLEIVLAQPVSRAGVLLARTLAACAELLGVLLGTSVLLWALGHTVDLDVGLWASARALGMLALLACEGLAVSVLLGALLGRAGRSRALAGATGLVAFLLAALGPSIESLSAAVSLSPFHTLVASDPFRQAPGAGHVVALVVPSALMVAGALTAFRRRDLRLP